MKRLGIILAAGLSIRMNNLKTKPFAKPLLLVNDLALLLRSIKSLEVARCNKVVIVLGWQSKSVKKYVLSKYKGPIELTFVYNKEYHLSNGISVLSARPYIDDKFLLTMADHVLHDGIMELASNHNPPEGGAVLCVDYKLEDIFDIDDATKVLEKSGFIISIGKQLIDYNCIDTGVFIGTQGLMEEIEKIYKLKGDVSLTEGVQALAEKNLMKVLDIKTCFWQDVDNDAMLKHAEKLLQKHKKGNQK